MISIKIFFGIVVDDVTWKQHVSRDKFESLWYERGTLQTYETELL